MILIADSGGTKTHWAFVDGSGIMSEQFTSGLNLNVLAASDVVKSLREEVSPDFDRVSALHFYGAGLGTEARRKTMLNCLRDRFPNAKISVEHDLLGAARALCGSRAGIVCILGTGSNACLYDGENIIGNRGGHGWILGDEGSGADIGKYVLKAALDGELPLELTDAVQNLAGMDLLAIRGLVYRGEAPNAFLGRLAKVAAENQSHPFISRLLQDRFGQFLEKTVLEWKGKGLALSFVGGIAKGFESTLRSACIHHEFNVNRVVASPMEGLAHWHLEISLPH